MPLLDAAANNMLVTVQVMAAKGANMSYTKKDGTNAIKKATV
jgi:hypothetical protein